MSMPDAPPAMPTREEAQAYLDEQGLVELLQTALNQCVYERAPNGAARLAELCKKAAYARENATRMRELFAKADTSGNGLIDIEELYRRKASNPGLLRAL